MHNINTNKAVQLTKERVFVYTYHVWVAGHNCKKPSDAQSQLAHNLLQVHIKSYFVYHIEKDLALLR